jgi:hypothetical protein
MAKDLIYKVNGAFQYSGDIEPFIVQSDAEVATIPASDNAQAAVILGTGDGMTVKMRLPGGNWTEV